MELAIDLTKRKLRVCSKCGRSDTIIERHHRGHEKLLSWILPEKYKERYELFHKEDIVELCKKHHKKYHHLARTQVIVGQFWALVGSQQGKLTHKQAEEFRSKFRKNTDKWLSRPVRGAGGILKQINNAPKNAPLPRRDGKKRKGRGVERQR